MPQETVEVVFSPQEWAAGYAIAAQDRDTVTYEVPREDATDDNGDLYEDDTYESDQLSDHENAPEWVQDWSGPFYVTIRR
jgi:hypothetical protein